MNYNDIVKLKRVEETAASFGFKLARSVYCDNVSLTPINSAALPIYNRDTHLFTGSIEDISIFLSGVEWARMYDNVLSVSDTETRASKEQIVRNRQLMHTLRNSTGENDNEHV